MTVPEVIRYLSILPELRQEAYKVAGRRIEGHATPSATSPGSVAIVRMYVPTAAYSWTLAVPETTPELATYMFPAASLVIC